MRDPQRIDRIINKLRNLWKTYQDLRFNQMNFDVISEYVKDGADPFFLEDDEFEKLIDRKIVERSNEILN